MSVEQLDVGVVPGELWAHVFGLATNGVPDDLTGRVAQFVIAPNVDATPTVVLTSAADPTAVTVDLAAGTITVTLTGTVTGPLSGLAEWALWLDYGQPDADALAAGNVQLQKVVHP